ncbi:MAG: FecR domain-containing protein [Pseudomonadota bacterium]
MTNRVEQSNNELLELAHDWMLRVEDPDVSAADRLEFETWLNADPRHSDIYDQALTFRDAFSSLSNTDFDSAVTADLYANAEEPTQTAAVLPFRRAVPAVLALAASVLLAVAIAPRLFNTALDSAVVEPVITTVQSAIGETRSVTLDDGSSITLGPATTVTTRFTAEYRYIELTGGAAYFDVAPDPDRPFSVEAGRLTAMALGTAFDVRSRAGVVRVAVAEGTVGVSHPLTVAGRSMSMDDTQVLTVGQEIAATTADGLRPIKSVDADQIGAWRSGRLIYNGASVAELLADANRYSTRSIEVAAGSESILDLQIRGAFVGQNIDDLLAGLAAIHPVDIDASDPARIVVRRRP